MNDTHSDESSVVVTTTTIVGSFMLFMICFALSQIRSPTYNYIDNTNQIRSPSEECSPPIYVVDSHPTHQESLPPPTYQESLPPPSYPELNSHTQTSTQVL
jgi:hypothetical protein